ncbi:MAG TPA: hypothetical protein VGB13_08440 [Candidatus Krumholzibacteria bacterium]|jgi:hypothetical protein
MSRQRTTISFLFFFSLASGALAGGIPEPGPSYATSAAGKIEFAPDRSGPTLAERGLTVTVVVLDSFGFPIPGYPFQDIFLFDTVGGAELSLCRAGSYASGNTDGTGTTTIDSAVAGGGWTANGLQVYLAGLPLDPIVSPPLDITVASADLNADLAVDLADLVTVPGGFANLFLNGSYDFQVDFNGDDVENILDVVRFAELFLSQATCP